MKYVRTIDITDRCYIAETPAGFWHVYKGSSLTSICANEEQARESANGGKISRSDGHIIADDARALDHLIRSENGLGVNSRW